MLANRWRHIGCRLGCSLARRRRCRSRRCDSEISRVIDGYDYCATWRVCIDASGRTEIATTILPITTALTTAIAGNVRTGFECNRGAGTAVSCLGVRACFVIIIEISTSALCVDMSHLASAIDATILPLMRGCCCCCTACVW